MWKLFIKENTSVEEILDDLDKIKASIFYAFEKEVKEYFAKKVVIYFDNFMIFQQKRGLHINLMEALSTAEKDKLDIRGVFPKVDLYWIREDLTHTLVIFGLDNEKEFFLEEQGFKLIQRDSKPKKKQQELEHIAYKTLLFDVELVNYAINWVNHTPEIEERSLLQAEYILLNMHFKKEDLSLLEKIEFEKNIKSHPSYNELYNKVLRVMPKIENSLEQEWRTGNLEKIVIQHNQNKRKNKI